MFSVIFHCTVHSCVEVFWIVFGLCVYGVFVSLLYRTDIGKYSNVIIVMFQGLSLYYACIHHIYSWHWFQSWFFPLWNIYPDWFPYLSEQKTGKLTSTLTLTLLKLGCYFFPFKYLSRLVLPYLSEQKTGKLTSTLRLNLTLLKLGWYILWKKFLCVKA